MVKCLLCGTFCAHPDDPEWMVRPFCWKCGTYLQAEGNYFGWGASKAKARAEHFDAHIDALIDGGAGDG